MVPLPAYVASWVVTDACRCSPEPREHRGNSPQIAPRVDDVEDYATAAIAPITARAYLDTPIVLPVKVFEGPHVTVASMRVSTSPVPVLVHLNSAVGIINTTHSRCVVRVVESAARRARRLLVRVIGT
jgi:hypothetical protein